MARHSILMQGCCLFLLLFTVSLGQASEIHDAAMIGDVATVEKLLNADPSLVAAKTEADWTPLHYAAREGHRDVAQLLVSRGARLSALVSSDRGEYLTPRNMAVRQGHDEVVLLLASAEATLRGGVDRVIAEARSGEHYSRLRAIDLLGDLQDMRAVEALTEVLKDRDWIVRSCAAEALGKLQDPRAADALAGALPDDDVLTRRTAARALARWKDPRAVPELLNMERELWEGVSIVDRDRAWKEKGKRAYYKSLLVAMGPAAVEPLILDLKESDSTFTAEVLGEISDVRAYGPLLKSLERESARFLADSTWLRRRSFLQKLILAPILSVGLGVQKFAEIVSGVPPEEQLSPDIAEDIEDLLGTSRAREQKENSAFETVFGPHWRKGLATIEESVDAEREPELVQNLVHRDADVREGCALLLRKLRTEESFTALCGALRDQSDGVRAAAAGSLSAWGLEALDVLVPLLSDPAANVRVAVAGYLISCGREERVKRPLQVALRDGDPQVRGLAAIGLARFGEDVVPTISRALARERDKKARTAMEQALKTLTQSTATGSDSSPR